MTFRHVHSTRGQIPIFISHFQLSFYGVSSGKGDKNEIFKKRQHVFSMMIHIYFLIMMMFSFSEGFLIPT